MTRRSHRHDGRMARDHDNLAAVRARLRDHRLVLRSTTARLAAALRRHQTLEAKPCP
jgi:hypothetical protein